MSLPPLRGKVRMGVILPTLILHHKGGGDFAFPLDHPRP